MKIMLQPYLHPFELTSDADGADGEGSDPTPTEPPEREPVAPPGLLQGGGGGGTNLKNDMRGLTPSQMKSVQFYIAVNERRKAGVCTRDACEEIGFNGATYKHLREGRVVWFNDCMAAVGIPLSP